MKNLSDRAALEVMDSIREEIELDGITTLTKRDLAWLSPAFVALNEKYFRDHPEAGDGSPSIDVLKLSIRTSNALIAEGITTVKKLTALKEWQLLRIPNLGKRSLAEIKEALSGYSSDGASGSATASHE